MTDLTGGGWVVTWQSNQSGTNDIYQSVYAADGSLMQKAGGGAVADQAVVSAAPSLQVNPTVTALSGGGWVVTWQSFQSGTYDIYQSVYAADGSVVVDQAVVSAAAGHQGHPTVTGLDGGGWVVTWASNQSGSYHVYQSVYAADGSVVVDQAVVSAAAADPTVTALSGGGWVVTWASDQSGSYHVYQSVYAADGSVVVDQAVVSAAAGYQAYPTVTGLDGGGWVVAWTSSQSGTPDIYQSVYAADGSLMQKLGGGFVAKEAVVSAAANDQSLPTVTALSGGGWVVAVADQANVTPPLGSEGTKGAMFPAVAAVDGGWVVAWEYGGSTGTFGVYQSVYASNGSLKEKSAGGGVIAEKAVVSDGILSDQRNPAVATFGEGWIVVWRSNEASTSRDLPDDLRQRRESEQLGKQCRSYPGGQLSKHKCDGSCRRRLGRYLARQWAVDDKQRRSPDRLQAGWKHPARFLRLPHRKCGRRPRRPDPTEFGGHGPFRRRLGRHLGVEP